MKKITDALVAKDGIVPDDVRDKFRTVLKTWRPKAESGRAPSPLEERQQLMDGVLEEQSPDLHKALKKHRSFETI